MKVVAMRISVVLAFCCLGEVSLAADPASTQAASAATSASSSSTTQSANLSEIVVTAQKKSERLQDVPLAVTVLDAQALVDTNQLSIQDYYSSIPGLSLTSSGRGDDKISIRGLMTSSSFANPTVGVVVDDAPYGSSTAYGAYRSGVPDIDPSDLLRIEVLRGPQGTLYGASSIGGLIKFVTVDPSTEGFTGRVEADGSGIQNGTGLGGAVRGAVNIPVTDSIALRVSAYYRESPGYLDDSVFQQEGVNKVEAYGGRFAALWKVSDTWSVKLSGLFQNTRADGSGDGTLDAGINPLDQLRAVNGAGAYTNRNQSYVANVNGPLGPVNLVSITSYSIAQAHQTQDTTNEFGTLPQNVYGVPGTVQYDIGETAKFSQEIRASGAFLERFEWLSGLYYSHEDDSKNRSNNYAVDPATGAIAGLIFGDAFPTVFDERAVFVDLTTHFTSQFDVQIGGRASENKQSYSEIYTGPYYPAVQPLVHTSEDSFTYLVTPRFRFSDDLMTYVRVASGYRPGGPNPTCTLFPTPCAYKADTSINYELGLKGSTPDHRLSFDASLYYIDWKDMQISVANDYSYFFANAGRAKSQGIELSGQWQPLGGITLGAWVSWNDAVLREGFPSNSGAVGFAGDRLPYSSRFSANVSADKSMSFGKDLTGVVGAMASYVGPRAQDFGITGGPPRGPDLAGYTKIDLHANLLRGPWTAGLFANNISDQRGVLSLATRAYTTPNTEAATFIQPRTIGVSLSRRF